MDEKIKEEQEVKNEKGINEVKATIADLDSLVLEDDVDESVFDKPNPLYTTELLNSIKELKGTLTSEQFNAMVEYVRGGERPDFMDIMLTQTNDKLSELLKVMVMLELLRLPTLYDYLNSLHSTMLDVNAIKDMSYEDMSKEATNIQKEIADILSLSMKVTTSLSNSNQIPTKVERLANALLAVSDSTRQRIEEIIAMESK